MKNKETLFIAFSNQKGGVGKTAFTVLMASYFHYKMGKNVLVVDADHPQHSIEAMRKRDKEVVGMNDYYKQLLMQQFNETNRKAYPVIPVIPELAKEAADKYIAGCSVEFDMVFFDLPGTVNTEGIFKSLMNMDYIFTPIIMDRMAMQSSLAFASTIQNFVKGRNDIPLKKLCLFWNMLDSRVSKELFDLYNIIMKRLQLDVLETVMPLSHRYSKELSMTGKPFFRSTLFPPLNNVLEGSKLNLMVDEICKIINI